MSEEKVITLTEFKVMMDEMRSRDKKIIEVMQHNQDQNNKNFARLEGRMDRFENRTDRMEGEIKGEINGFKADVVSLKQEVALLHEGQTEIKGMLNQKVDREEFNKLEKRVVRLEHKRA
jgi:hypothetical protein